jgi:hypothetical protein
MLREAQHHYEQTGEHMGIFESPDYADSYAIQTHGRTMPEQNASHHPLYVNPTKPQSVIARPGRMTLRGLRYGEN